MDFILDGLNDQQRTAVTSEASVLQVLAPPGSGKTKTLTARVAHLIAYKQLSPWNIIVCTFTIKAAREMKERIRNFVGEELGAKLILGTFHSVARRYLVSYGHNIGISKNFGVADSSDSLSIIKRIIKRRDLTVEPGRSRSRISGLKAKGISADNYAATLRSTQEHEFAAVYAEYEECLRTSNLLDYDDLLLRCGDLLRRHPECVAHVQAVLIDEFQDTNHVQYELMSLFASRKKFITIVGDPDQSIYGFRSAEIANLQRMQKQYPDTLVVNLEENYRSAGAILQSAQELIEQDESRPAKKLQATHSWGKQPVLRRVPSADAEARWIVSEIRRTASLAGGLFLYDDYAILLRSAALSRQIESKLGEAGIPYRMVGGTRFFDRKEVQVLLDYMRVISHPEHNDALVRVINVPSRKIGDVTVEGLLEDAEKNKVSLWKVIADFVQGKRRPEVKVATSAAKGFTMFFNIISTARRKLTRDDHLSCSVRELMEWLIEKLAFHNFLKEKYKEKEDFENRWSNVEELLALAVDAAVLASNDALPTSKEPESQDSHHNDDTLSAFLANVALATDTQRENGDQKWIHQVTISTIHAAKGLEWPVVFIPAVYEGSIPHSRAEDTDEERRLLYVGMTRAKALLYLSCPVKNSQQGETTLSNFLAERRMQKYFAKRGPTLQYKCAQGLASILRRPCPTEIGIRTMSLSVERHEDDFWSLDGEPSQETHLQGWSIGSSTVFANDYPVKRRRLEACTTGSVSSVDCTMHDTAGSSMTSTTMKGFGSASAYLKELQNSNVNDNTSACGVKDKAKGSTTQCRKMTSKNSTTTQGGLLDYFSMSTKSHDGEPVLERASQPTAHSSRYTPRNNNHRLKSPLRDVSNYSSSASVALVARATPVSAMSKHSLRTTTYSCPRVGDWKSPEPTEQRHIFLSSSPPRAEEDEDGRQIEASNEHEVTEVALKGHGMKPASIFHSTSAQSVQSAGQGPRRTLGPRRSRHGWSSRGHSRFNGPRRV